MATPYLEKYKTGSFPFPEDNINPQEKDKKWAKKYGEAIISLFFKNRTAIPYNRTSEIAALRALADGRQDPIKYKKILLDESEESGELEGYMNVSFDVFSMMPKFMRVVEGMLEQTDHQVVATAIDPKSSGEKEELRLRTAFNMKFHDILSEIEQGLGMDVGGQFLPETVEELELYSGMGGFKLARETEIEEGLDYTFFVSEWKEIKKRLEKDFATFHAMCVKDYTDQFTKKVKVRYVDPAFFIGQKSKSYDGRSMEWAGEIVQLSASEIVKQDPDVDLDELKKLARLYNGRNGNATLGDTDLSADYSADPDKCRWANFLLDILDFEWKSVDSEYWTTRKNKYGNELSYEEKWGTVSDGKKRKTRIYNIHTIYKAQWVIGTEIVFDFGPQHDIPRPGGKEVALSYHFYSRSDKSIVESSEPALDQIALAHIKLQNALAKAAPSGISIEYTSLLNMKLGANKMEPLELLAIRKQSGDLIYKATTHRGQVNIPGGYRPVQELIGGIGPQLDEFIKIFDLYLEFIRDATGVNQIADASTPHPEQSVGGSQLAVAATNNALRPLYSAYITTKERVAKNVSMRIQLLIKHNKKAYDGYVPVLGRVGVRIISVSADVVDADYYIKYEAKPTEERKQVILNAAIAAMSPGQDGLKDIELGDFLFIERLLNNGNLKHAEAYLNYRSKKNQEKRERLQAENMRLNAEHERESAVMKHEMEKDMEKFKTDQKIRFEEAKLELEERYKGLDHEREKEKIALESTMDTVGKMAAQGAGAEMAEAI